jgi:hypothetical protein
MAASRHIAARAALVVAALVVAPAGAVAQGPDTDPSVRPRTGGPHTTFVLQLTARQDIGGRGAASSLYTVRVAIPSRPACGRVARITSARAGEPISVPLRPAGGAGWCRGRYRGRVLLVRGPNCSPPSSAGCPRFASRITAAGRFAFRVR